MNNITETMNDNIDSFPGGLYSQTRMQLLAWVFQVPATNKNCGYIEVKIKMMRGIHTFRRDWTTQAISCNPWSTRLHPYPSLIRKMKTYLELQGKHDNQLHTNIFLPHKNSLPRKTPVPKKAEKKRQAKAPVKRSFKLRVITQPMSTNPALPANSTLSTEPTPTVATTMTVTQMPVARTAVATTTAKLVTIYNLAQGKFKGIPYPTKRL